MDGDTARIGVRRIPELRTCILHRARPAGRRSEMVRAIQHHRQSTHLSPSPIHPSILLIPLTLSALQQSSSFLGPLLVGLIADLTGNIRYSFFFLFFMVWCAVPILFGVDVVEGRRDARVVGEENKRARGRDWA
jgi:hypothetical protein